jgi:hypothetical protein
MTSKHRPKNRTQLETKNQLELRYVFFTNFQGTKTPNMNSPHQMKQFDTNIIHFGGIN